MLSPFSPALKKSLSPSTILSIKKRSCMKGPTLYALCILTPLCFLFSCTMGPPEMTLVGGVRVEEPVDRSVTPEVITIPLPRQAALDRIKMDLVRAGFVLAGEQDQLGVIQTDAKVLGSDEEFTKGYSKEQHDRQDAQNAACCAGGILAAAAVVTVAAVTSDHDNNKKNCTSNPPEERHHDHDDYCDHHHDEAVVSVVTQNRGRLQVIAMTGQDSAQTKFEVTAFLSTSTNGSKGSEVQAMRMDPFLQKYACLLIHRECGRAPGQKLYVEPKKDTVRQQQLREWQ
jgi:hypothetical protein